MIERDKFSTELKEVLDYVENQLASYDFPSVVITPEYFFLGVLNNRECEAHKTLVNLIPENILSTIAYSISDYLSSKSLSAIKPKRSKKFDEKLEEYFNVAKDAMEKSGDKEITTDMIVFAMLADIKATNNRVGRILLAKNVTPQRYVETIHKKTLAKLNGDDKKETPKNNKRNKLTPFGERITVDLTGFPNPEEIMNKVIRGEMSIDDIEEERMSLMGKNGKSNIENFCTNLNELVENNKIDALIGREYEIDEIIRVLGRRRKNNVILVGEGGVGKTAIAENIARKIVEKKVPDFMLDKILISLDITALSAGTTLRGMFEERVKGLLNEIKASGKYILLIDNIGNVMSDHGRNDYDISGMLSHAMENGELQVIGTCDYKAYRKTFDKDPSLSRKFQKVTVEPPTIENSIEILNGLKQYYEDYHNVKYTNEALTACVELSAKYVPERNLPDSAIDVLDEAGATISIYQKNEGLPPLEKQLEKILLEITRETEKENYKRIDELTKIKDSLEKQISEKKEEFEKHKKENPIIVDENAIRELISKKTNIPISRLTTDDKERLNGINDRLKAEVIGQDGAIDTICHSIKRNRIGLSNAKCLYSALNIGATGLGKTLLAKKLAKEMFGTEDALIRFDMSEYPDKTAVNKLIGSNPGYVGYEDGGLLTEAIKKKKYCVLLLDEIEKADPEVYNIFLQVLDEGFLTDNSGMKVDFRNVIVLFTSNVGTKTASEFGKGIGFTENVDENKKRILLKELKKRFPPEFINRLNDVIYFNNLTDDNLKKIIEIELRKLKDRVGKIGYGFGYTPEIINKIFDIVITEREYGARPIVRAIEEQIENKITDFLIETKTDEIPQTLLATWNDDKKEIEIM